MGVSRRDCEISRSGVSEPMPSDVCAVPATTESVWHVVFARFRSASWARAWASVIPLSSALHSADASSAVIPFFSIFHPTWNRINLPVNSLSNCSASASRLAGSAMAAVHQDSAIALIRAQSSSSRFVIGSWFTAALSAVLLKMFVTRFQWLSDSRPVLTTNGGVTCNCERHTEMPASCCSGLFAKEFCFLILCVFFIIIFSFNSVAVLS
jgi:hypothetical protein